MQRIAIDLCLAAIIGFSAFTAVKSYKIDTSKAKVTFNIVNMGLTVEGAFDGARGAVYFDENNLAGSRIEASVDASTINTGIGMRDDHLREPDYFDVEKYPRISFQSTSIERSGNGYKATGKFTIRDVTKTVTVPFTFSNGTFKGDFSIKRTDYGVGESSWVMKDKVKIFFEIPVL